MRPLVVFPCTVRYPTGGNMTLLSRVLAFQNSNEFSRWTSWSDHFCAATLAIYSNIIAFLCVLRRRCNRGLLVGQEFFGCGLCRRSSYRKVSSHIATLERDNSAKNRQLRLYVPIFSALPLGVFSIQQRERVVQQSARLPDSGARKSVGFPGLSRREARLLVDTPE